MTISSINQTRDKTAKRMKALTVQAGAIEALARIQQNAEVAQKIFKHSTHVATRDHFIFNHTEMNVVLKALNTDSLHLATRQLLAHKKLRESDHAPASENS